MNDKKETTIEEAFALNHWDSIDFFKVLALGIVLGDTLHESVHEARSPGETEDIVYKKMMSKVGKKIPGMEKDVFTEDMCNALIGLFGEYGHLFLNF